MLTQVLCVIAEFERGLIRERCQAGRVEARNRGIRFGSPPRISRDQVLQLRAEGLTWRKVGARLGCKGDTARLIGTGTYRACDRAAAVEPLASPVAVYRKALACGSA
jgi:DNA invertase Pin-like site-specific DNA recombinase